MGAENVAPTGIRFRASPALRELLYRLSYRRPPCILTVEKSFSSWQLQNYYNFTVQRIGT